MRPDLSENAADDSEDSNLQKEHFMERKRVLCFGDSNTYGWMGSLVAPTRRYPASVRWTGRLAAGLGEEWDVLEEGLGGRTLRDRRTEGSGIPLPGAGLSAMDYLPSCLLSHLPLDAVIVMLGSNDMKSVLRHSETDIADAMADLVDMIRLLPWESLLDYPHPGVIIVSPPLIGERKMLLSGARYADAPRKSRMLAGLYRKVAESRGAFFLDAAEALAGDPWGEAHGPDGMHLDEKDHARLAEALLGIMRSAFPSGKPVAS